jgi:ADP-ribose pyrophosphatase YjhB (NUDIX family)
MENKKFVVCVDGVYVKDGKILLLKRNVEPFKGCWHVVGGHVDEDESLKDAVKREFKEETGLDVTVGDVIDGRLEVTFDRVKIIAVFEVTSAEGEVHLNFENEAYDWFDKVPSNSVYDYAKYLPNNNSVDKGPRSKL